jgi:hypothetical protein
VTRTREPAPDDTAVLPPVPAGVEPAGERGPDDGLAAELAAAAPRRWWNRGTLVLGACALLLGGFLGGAQVQQRWGTAPATSNRPAGFTGPNGAAFPGFAGGARGTGAPGGAAPTAPAAAAGTTGTVKLVDGSTLYVQTADGTVVTVRTSGKTTVQTASKGALKDLKAGQAVSVQGAADPGDGSVTATSVTATSK